MAKKTSQTSMHTHIPSHIGFGILALVVLAFGLLLATQYTNNQTETTQPEAAAICGGPRPMCIYGYTLTCTNGKWHCIKKPKSSNTPPKTSPTVVTNSSQCIQYQPTYNAKTGKTGESCTLYQNTTTTVNTNSPCLEKDTSGHCTYYQGTTQNVYTVTPTIPEKPKTTTSVPVRGCTAWYCYVHL